MSETLLLIDAASIYFKLRPRKLDYAALLEAVQPDKAIVYVAQQAQGFITKLKSLDFEVKINKRPAVQLTVDALSAEVKRVVIVTSDADFAPLLERLRLTTNEVIVFSKDIPATLADAAETLEIGDDLLCN